METNHSLTGKTIIVTGAAQGIGRGIAERALASGANVVLADLNGQQVRALASERPERMLACEGSVTDPAFAPAVVRQAIERFGAVHGLVNNAGISRAAMIEKMELDAWQAVLDVHLTGAFHFLQATGRHMVERAKAGEKAPGAIVNISSDAGRRGSIGQINYSVAKAGMLGMTMSAAREWARHGIRVNTVMFGVVETPMTDTILNNEKFRDTYLAQIPMGRWSTPQEVSKPVCFLLSDDASYITGQHLSVNGGFTINV